MSRGAGQDAGHVSRPPAATSLRGLMPAARPLRSAPPGVPCPRLFKLCSVLLQYPTPELVGARHELGAALLELDERSRDATAPLVERLGQVPLHELQAEYVRTFDFDRRASLHLTYHTHGDRRQRGVELVRLKRRFADAGLSLADGELPDYLPVLLEFAALAPEAGAVALAELRGPLELVRSRLNDGASPYAGVLDAIVHELPRLSPAQEARIRRLALDGPPTELVGLEPFAAAPELAQDGVR